MKATEFEFRYRFWLIGLIFWLAFSTYGFDHVDITQAIADRFAHPGGLDADSLVRIVFVCGTLLVAGACLIRTWATAYLRSEVVHDSNLHSESLVADGPYRRVRNPLYLGNIFLALGMGTITSRTGFVILVGGMILFVLRLIGREEAQLDVEHGERFREFCRRVPRLWPALLPRVPAGGLQPRWGQAFVGEIFIWGFFVGMLAFAITLKIALLWIFVAAGILFRILLSSVQSRQGKTGTR
ncbi:MAG: methyltransferase family protein [Candidatus Acidiferrales bacterium]